MCGAAVAGAVSGPHPSAGCDTWKAAVSGNYNVAGNWSTGAVPDAQTPACITLPGTYTVSVTDAENAASVTLGSGTGAQPTLSMVPKGQTGAAYLTVTDDIANQGAAITFSSTGSSASVSAVLSWGGTLTNQGTITTAAGTAHGIDYLEGDLQNTATVTVGGPTFFDASPADFTNTGTVTVNSGATFTVTGSNEFDNLGTVSSAGTMIVQNESTLTMAAGSTHTGTAIQVSYATLVNHTTAAAAYDFVAGGEFVGNVAAGQTLMIDSLTGDHTTDVTAPQSWTNAGTITLTSVGNIHAGSQESSLLWKGTLTNSGTLNVLTGSVSDYRYLYGVLLNTGTVHIAAPLAYYSPYNGAGGQFTSRKTVTIDSGAQLQLQNATFTNSTNGVVTNNGAMLLDDSEFEQAGGRTAGTNPVRLVDSSTLAFEAAGASKFLFTQDGTMTGDIAAGQSVTIAGVTATNDTTVTEPAGFTNAGTITLTTQGASTGAAQAAALDWSGHLDNEGTINATAGSTGGERDLSGSYLDNNGTISVNAVDLIDPSYRAKVRNTGTISISGGRTLGVPNSGYFTQTAAGTLSLGVGATKAGSVVPQYLATLDGTLQLTGTGTSGRTYTVVGIFTREQGAFATVTPSTYTVTYSATRVAVTAP